MLAIYSNEFSIDRIYEIPDFTQNNDTTELPAGGAAFCAPVAVSNSMMWLWKMGFDRIVTTCADPYKDQLSLIMELASPDYMQTSEKSGTTPFALTSGVWRFMKDRGYKLKRFEAQSIRTLHRCCKLISRQPELEFIREGLQGYGCVWLLIGWYGYDSESDCYWIKDGHWVAVVGYGKDESGKLDPEIIIIHDSSVRAGNGFSNQYIRIRKLESGTVVYWEDGKKHKDRSAAGLLSCEGGMKLKGDAAALIQSVIVMEPEPPEPDAD